MRQRGLAALHLILYLFFAGCARSRPSPSVVHDIALQTPAPVVPLGQPHFVEITSSSGLDFKQINGGCGRSFLVEQVAAGACLFDANGDGFLDIYFPQPKPLAGCKPVEKTKHRLYLNDGKGHFKLSPDAFGGVETDYGISAAVGDFDNDGHPDLYVCCYGKNKLFHNRGNGTFEDVTEHAGVVAGGMSTGAVWFDYDGDGRLDLYVARYSEWTEAKNIPCPGPDGDVSGCSIEAYPASTHFLFHNNGDGTFTNVTAKAMPDMRAGRGLGVAAFDYDGDGKLDLMVANDRQHNFLWHNLGGGIFEEAAMQTGAALGMNGKAQANMGLAIGDYNNSGRPSVLVTTFANEAYTLYRNDGSFFVNATEEAGVAKPTMPYLGWGTGFFDSCNSGNLDLFFANGHVTHFNLQNSAGFKERNQLLLNDGNGHFTEAADSLPKDDIKVHRGACFGDVDNDGRVDVLVTASNDRPTLLQNASKSGNWLLLKLTNKWGCCTPIGTKCKAIVGGKSLTRYVLGGGSYGGDSDFRVHFGLADAKSIDSLEIHWLSGKVQILKNVKANQILSVKEPQ